jgi:uncharacterized protein
VHRPGNDESPLSSTPRTRLRRYPQRGRTDRRELYEILDTGLLCYLGVISDGHPRVIPMAYGRIGDTLYLHGSVKNQALTAAKDGGEVCVTVTNVYGLVLANSLFHHSVNFRSAMVYGTARVVTDDAERIAGVRAAADQLVPGRSDALPEPTLKQLKATMVMALPLEEASVKVREGSPNGDAEDYERDIWAGVVPLVHTWGEPVDDEKLRTEIPVPAHVARLVGQPALRTPR